MVLQMILMDLYYRHQWFNMSRTFRRKNIVQPTIKNWIESKLPNRRYYIWYRDAIRLYRELDNSENKNIVIKKAENVYKRDGFHFDKLENHSKYYRNYTEKGILPKVCFILRQ